MSETASATVTYTPLQSGDGESRWIRLEQVQATLPGPPLPDVADVLDRLFNVEPCDNGMGGGGEEYGEELPSADELDEMLSIVLERNGQCNQGWWLAAVNVYRTHRQPGYELRSETARVQTVRQVTESYSQVVDVDGPQIALERPYAGRLSGIPRGVNWEVRGATVNLDRPVHDRLILRYDTWHEHVTLRVPTRKTPPSPQGGVSEEYEPAAVVAFWGDMAAECELEPPEPESEEDQEARRNICNRQKPEKPEPGGCWKIIRHYQLCECSKTRVNDWEEKTGAPCDGAEPGTYVGSEEKFDGYVGGLVCGDDEYDREMQTLEFYLRHCCKPSPVPLGQLPTCRSYYGIYRGGHKIEEGADYWRERFGKNVRLYAVVPEQGYCGEMITNWDIPDRNCCDGVDPMTPHPNNPENIEPGHSYGIGVLGGKKIDAEFRWQASGGIVFKENQSTSITTDGPSVWIEARENICPQPTVTVDDGCSTLSMTFSGPGAEPPTLSKTDMPVDPDSTFSLSASGGVPPYMWQASGGIELLGWSADGATAYFRAGERDAWCVETITVVDQCGNDATCTVRNSLTGRWERIYDFDQCSPPGAGGPPEIPGAHRNSRFWTMPHDGYRLYVYGEERTEASRLQCPVGNVISPREAELRETCLQKNNPRIYDMSYSQGDCVLVRKSDGYTVHYYDADYAIQVWKWICGN